MEKIKYVPRIIWIKDELYKQNFYLINCKREDFKPLWAKTFKTTPDKITINLDGCDGMCGELENTNTNTSIPFVWVVDGGGIETLYHELLHKCFEAFNIILCDKYVTKENEEPFCYYFDYLSKITKEVLIKKYGPKKTTKKVTKKVTKK